MQHWHRTYLLLLLLQRELLLLHHLELVAEVELSGLLLQLGEFVFVFGDLLQGWLDAVNRNNNRLVIDFKSIKLFLLRYLQLAAKIVNLGIEIVDLCSRELGRERYTS